MKQKVENKMEKRRSKDNDPFLEAIYFKKEKEFGHFLVFNDIKIENFNKYILNGLFN